MKLKLFFLVLLAQMFSMTAFAYDAKIDGIPAPAVPDGYTAATYSFIMDGVTYNSIDELNAAVATMAPESTHAVQVIITGDATDGTKTVIPGDVFKFTIPVDGGEIVIPSVLIPNLPSLGGWEIVMERKLLVHHNGNYNYSRIIFYCCPLKVYKSSIN